MSRKFSRIVAVAALSATLFASTFLASAVAHAAGGPAGKAASQEAPPQRSGGLTNVEVTLTVTDTQ
jgi:hypothetical protein